MERVHVALSSQTRLSLPSSPGGVEASAGASIFKHRKQQNIAKKLGLNPQPVLLGMQGWVVRSQQGQPEVV
eukprot:scaffold11736_cov159-Ochromonas_danica.AAC.8